MSAEENSLEQLVGRLSGLTADADYTAGSDPADRSWWFSGSDFRLRLFVRNGSFVLARSDRGGSERDVFESPLIDDLEKFLIHWFCADWRANRGFPMLLVAYIPVTADKLASGYSLARDGRTWVLKEDATGVERRAGDLALIEFSHYGRLSPGELRDACLAPEGKPPFFPKS